jgi:hypothetical protein
MPLCMTTLRTLLLGCLATCFVFPARAADKSRVELTRGCTSQLTERIGALVARDWNRVDRLARQYLATCKAAVDNEGYSAAFVHVAMANLELGNIPAALSASESCIVTYYPNSECHISKLEALIAAGQLTEAKSTFSIAERLVERSLESTQHSLRDAKDASERGRQTSRLQNLNSQKRYLDALRRRYFSQ